METRRKRKAGYTLIELGIVLAVLAILAGLVFQGQGVGRNQLILIREKAAIMNLFYRAKAMSIQRFTAKGGTSGQPQDVCAFGVVFEPGVTNGSFLFGDVADQTNDPCKIAGAYQGNVGFDSKDYPFTGPDDFYTPDTRASVTMTDGSGVGLSSATVLFIPPDPTPTSTSGVLFPISITIFIAGNTQASSTITITEGGLIEEQ